MAPNNSVSWDRLVRYLPQGDDANTGPARYGDPIIEGDEELGALASRGALQVRVLEGSNPFDATRTGKIETVGKLLGPLTVDDVPIIRCIGLNYKTHSKSNAQDNGQGEES